MMPALIRNFAGASNGCQRYYSAFISNGWSQTKTSQAQPFHAALALEMVASMMRCPRK